MKLQIRFFLTALIVLLALSVLVACKDITMINKPFIVEPKPSSPISVKLNANAFTEIPRLGSQANLIMEVSVHPSYGNAPNTIAKIILPEGVTLVSGETIWNGELKPENPITLSAIVRASKVGNWTIEASARSYFGYNNDSWYGDVENICFSASEDKATIISGECPTKLVLPSEIKELEKEPPQPRNESLSKVR